MFISVKLLNQFHEPLLYAVPASWSEKPHAGSLVLVPLREKTVRGLVMEVMGQKPENIGFVIKDALSLEKIPDDANYMKFITQLARYHAIDPILLIARLNHMLEQKKTSADQPYPIVTSDSSVTLSKQQASIVSSIIADISCQQYAPTLIHGVTGSGKTEIYKAALLHTLGLGKSALFLLPEVSLALAFTTRLKQELPPHTPLYSFHSASTAQEKRTLWHQLITGQPIIIVGVHLPVLLPISNLGLIIVDEEHEIGYQEKKHPKINSKDAALLRGQIYNIPVILGSATPSITTLYNVRTKGWKYTQLTQRFHGNFPEINVVLLTDKQQRKNFWISTPLYNAIKDRLAKKEQTILFINRRGFSFFVQCKSCSFVFDCPSCSVSLTLHDQNLLVCHYCSYTQQLNTGCPQCKTEESELLKKGIGTQQVASLLKKLFPMARIARADLDTTSQKKSWDSTLAQMADGSIDILVGTQTVTKGYDFAKVTLVGIIWADLNLHFPIYNAAERTLQQLIQVAGRAGRKHSYSQVIVQTMEYHDIFRYLDEQTYCQFFDETVTQRAMLGYPPCNRMAEIEIKHDNEIHIESESQAITRSLQAYSEQHKFAVQILGPSKPPVHKISSLFIRKIYLKGADHRHLVALFESLAKKQYTSALFFTPNPQN